MDKEVEIANKYGVPTCDTCLTLNWNEETLFSYIIDRETAKYKIKLSNSKYIQSKFEEDPNRYIIISAPQTHEIASILEKRITSDGDIFNFMIEFDTVSYVNDYETFVTVDVKGNNYAQACAELYLGLNQEGLI